MKRAALTVALALATAACAPSPSVPTRAPSAEGAGLAFLRGRLRTFPTGAPRGLLALTDIESGRVATYDSALVALVLARRGDRDAAGRVLAGLRALQMPDGAVPFSFALPAPDASTPYVRSGAVAWVGYAAAEYLDAERGGTARDEARALARGAGDYLLGRQLARPGDPRDGLVRGGAGTLRYAVDARGRVVEVLERGDVEWASVEHNVDAYFFFRALARVTGEARWSEAAGRIATGLSRAWLASEGQLARGVAESGVDPIASLDCASWGAVFLGAAGELARADTSAAVADARYASRSVSGARGHKAQARGPVLEAAVLREHAPSPARDWGDLALVWPEGSAGVALAAFRAGRVSRAREIVADLEALRSGDGSVPTATVAVPFVFDTRPSVAGTAWIELLRFELGRDPSRPTLWAP